MNKKMLQAMVAMFAAVLAMVASAESFKEAFPLGVYWAWERNKANAEAAGLDTTNYVAKALALCKAKNCNSVWIVNGPSNPAAPEFLDMCEKAGVKALLNTSLLHAFYNGLESDLGYVDRLARRTADSIGGKDALLGYILKDEPIMCCVQQVDYFYEVMKRIDPRHRDSTAVAMTPQIQTYIEDTSLPVLCTDIYHFGGLKSNLIPAPQGNSKSCYRATCANAVTVAEQRGKHVWIMPQAFYDIWGFHYYDEQGRHWCEPGTYIHWRMPTVAETRWQAWEAVRAGAKGVIFFILNSGTEYRKADVVEGGRLRAKIDKTLSWYRKHAVMHDKRRTENELTELPPELALTRFGGATTPQFDALGEAFGRIAKAKDVLLKCRRAPFPVFFSDDPDCTTATFAEPGRTDRAGVVVNDELNGKTRAITFAVPSNVTQVREIGGGEIALSAAKDGLRTFTLTLEPGDGRCLTASFRGDQPGMQLLHEDFLRHNTKGSVAAFVETRADISYNVGGPRSLVYRKEQAVTNAPVFTITGITNRKTANNTVALNLNRTKRNGNLWLSAVGSRTGLRAEAVLDKDAKAQETDIYHLQENAKDASAKGKDAAPTVPLALVRGMPTALPVGTTGIRFYLDEKNASLQDVKIWYTQELK